MNGEWKAGMSEVILDASAVLALLNGEPGAERVERYLLTSSCLLSAVNLTEILTRLLEHGVPAADAAASVGDLDLEVIDFDAELAGIAADLRRATRSAGLSLADRACLALARERGATAVTADRAWASVDLDIGIEVIRP
jgi:ribonuclease VapC